MNKEAKIYIAGHRGLVGSAIWRAFEEKGYKNLLGRSHSDLDLLDTRACEEFFEKEKPEYVVVGAAKVGGIWANNIQRADFIYQNLMIACNTIHAAYKYGVKKLIFLGSSCIYPKMAPQPMTEDCLLSSELEYTNEPYALAKISALRMCESYNIQYGCDFICLMPTNLYGENDNFDLETSHVLPAMIRKMHLAKLLKNKDFEGIRRDFEARPIVKAGASAVEAAAGVGSAAAGATASAGAVSSAASVAGAASAASATSELSEAEIEKLLGKYGISCKALALWGTGKVLREFLWSDDLAQACVYTMENISFWEMEAVKKLGYSRVLGCDGKYFVNRGQGLKNTHLNIGSGKEISIAELANIIKEVVGYDGDISFDASKPDGTPRKLLDVKKMENLGWKAKVELRDGIERLYKWYLESLG